ncbi:hypothetical protein DPMN_157223 [Dreissena polymorpha]|uniref:Uncharacterized protein n=1 Tax=Dreissena polymorpha TaxID=45954 RepID=A0A9D4IM26_DREPO|nr:hypothetical protein DPMN_157223 [Dreissena polymorpha]
MFNVYSIEIDHIVIREVQYQLEVNPCGNEEVIVKGNFGWVLSMWAGRPRNDRIVVREVLNQFEVNRCRNEESDIQGSSAYSDRQTDGQTDGQTAEITTISPRFSKSVGIIRYLVYDHHLHHPHHHCALISSLQQEKTAVPMEAITNLRTKFNKDWTINVTSRVLTRKTAPPLLAVTNVLTKFHKDWNKNVTSRMLTRKTAPPPAIIRTNVLTKFHEDWTVHVTPRVLTRKTAPPPGGHIF